MNNFIKKLSGNYFLIAISIFSAVAYFIFFPVVYEQNDDVIMQLIANGYISGKPEHFLVFINVIIGYFLQFFYQLFPSIEWYSIMQTSLLLLCFGTNIWCITKYENPEKKIILILLNLCLLYFFSRLQFTYISGFLAVSAAILQRYGFDNRNKTMLYFSGFLLLLSSLIRFEMFLFTYSVFWLFYILDFKNLRQQKLLIVTGIFILAAFLFNRYTYQSNPDYNSYSLYNKSRGKLIANLRMQYLDSENIPANMGIEPKDISLLRNHFIFTESMNTQKMEFLDNYTQKNYSVALSDVFRFIFSHTKFYFIALFIFMGISAITRNFRAFFAILFHLLLVIVIVKYFNIVQYRILYPVLFGLLFFYIKSLKIKESKIGFQTLALGFFLLLLFQWRDLKKTKYFSERSEKYIRNIEKQLPSGKIYLLDATSNQYIINRKAFGKPSVKLMIFGWMTNFPEYPKQYKSYSSNPFEMQNYPLIITDKNYTKLKDYIKNKEVYIITKNNQVIPKIKSE